MGIRDLMGRVDSRIDASRISDTMTLPDGSTVGGRFFASHREHELRDGSFVTLEISFMGPATEQVLALVEDELVEVDDTLYRFKRRLPDQGDESGRVLM